MRHCITVLLLVVTTQLLSQASNPAIGSWREHLPYNSAIDVTASEDKIYCATPYSLFVVDQAMNTIERWSRVTGLSETGVSTIRYDRESEKLFIAYSNSNIDIIVNNRIQNVPDLKRDNISGDKSIYNIYPLAGDFYLSTGIGIIIIDGERYEIRDSWFIGNSGNQVRVNGITSDAQWYYAATTEGLKKTSINGTNPANYSNWQLLSGSAGLPPGACQNVVTIAGKVVVQVNDSLFIQEANSWQLFYHDGWPIISSNISEDKIQLCQRQANGIGRVVILNADGTVSRILSQVASISFPRKAILHNGEPWLADQFGGLTRFSATSYENYKLNSPQSIASGQILVNDHVFYATSGEVNDAWNYQYNGEGFFVFKAGIWENINRYLYPQLDTLLDFITIAVDASDNSIWAGSYGGGLLHMKPGPLFEIHKQGRLGPAIGDPTSYRVSGLAFDRDNNLWISNYGSLQPLKVKTSGGEWISIGVPFFLNENAVSQIVIDDNNYKWIVSPKANGLICYDHGASIESQSDDRWKLLKAGAGNGNLPTNEVLSIAKDKNGYIWIGTSDGIAVIQCASELFSAFGCEAVLPIVQQGNFANYLFKGEEVQDIAVDAADRKWIATKNGVWLTSPAGDKIIYHFDETNSPLLSSEVKKIAIDGRTGEVYFATFKGICSFMSTATEANENNMGLLIFPNPVPPGFNGTIAVRGVRENAIVKITELDGRLVYQTRALGGQAIWDGKDYRGRKISSGVYLVLVSDETGKASKNSGRIVFLGR